MIFNLLFKTLSEQFHIYRQCSPYAKCFYGKEHAHFTFLGSKKRTSKIIPLNLAKVGFILLTYPALFIWLPLNMLPACAYSMPSGQACGLFPFFLSVFSSWTMLLPQPLETGDSYVHYCQTTLLSFVLDPEILAAHSPSPSGCSIGKINSGY